jgi:cell wall assembly regulator SMI1
VTLLDCEEIVEEWQFWKTVAQAYTHETAILSSSPPPSARSTRQTSLAPPSETAAGPPEPSTSATTEDPSTPTTTAAKAKRRQSKIFGQTQRFTHCRPPDTIQRVYAHPAWIPLAKDYNGNNIAVDLCPGPRGTWGQVILFGRDCETKYVVARSWASFLAAVAEDFEGGEARFVESADPSGSEELRIRACTGARDDSLFEVLKARVRLREREVRRKRETMIAGMQKGRTTPNGVAKDVGMKSPIVDLMANSPIINGDGIPSPNLPRSSESMAGSPVIGVPAVNGINGSSVEDKSAGEKIVIASPIPSKMRDENGVSGEEKVATTGLGIEGGLGVTGEVT